MKKIIALVLCVLLVFSLTACAQKAEETPSTDTPATDTPATETPAADEPADEAPAADEDKTVTVGLCNINEKGVFGKLVKYGFENACKERGWNLLYADNNSDGQTAVSNAETMALQSPDFVVDMNVDASVGQTIMDIFNNAGIPVLAVDIALPGAPFFGIDSAQLGYFNGETAAQYIKDNYDGAVDYVVLMTQIASGDEVQKRVRACVDALDDNGIGYTEVVELEGENDAGKSQQRFADFLTGHPDAESVVVFTINENSAQGVYAAACTADREWDIRIFSANCGSQFVEPMYASEGNQSWVCTISNFTELYGSQCCDLIEQYLATGEIADNTCCQFEAITWDNINDYYPLDNLPWNNIA